MKPFITGKKVFLRNVGKDEKWLQDIIEKDPSLLPFENLQLVSRERRQSSGGKLDFLMKSLDDSSMYEVEIMLGDTDPSHIIRCIEYWDIEKRRFPQRQHFAVLIAESFNRRYFNIIQLFSLNIPMIAVQLDIIESDNNYIVNFTKIMDIYEEVDDETESAEVKEDYWERDSPWVNNAAKKIVEELKKIDPSISLKYTQSYIAITKAGVNQYYFNKRAKPKFKIGFRISDQELSDKIKTLLDEKGLNYDHKSKDFVLTNIEVKDNLIKMIYDIHETRLKHKQIEKDSDTNG
ncbi:MAG: hypothetical protein L3K52_15605 [Candidatus Thiothrix sulfatifontis]|nr:MAG: hypothetical protein L3K52_15605 [Candidatus Thiothrix sulfatifontis]